MQEEQRRSVCPIIALSSLEVFQPRQRWLIRGECGREDGIVIQWQYLSLTPPPQTPSVPLFPYLLSSQDHSQSNSAGGKEVFEGNWNTPELRIRPPSGRIVAVEDFAVFIVIRWSWPAGGLAFRDQVHKKKRLFESKNVSSPLLLSCPQLESPFL